MQIIREGKNIVAKGLTPDDLQAYPELENLGFYYHKAARKVLTDYSEYNLTELMKLTENPDFYDLSLDSSLIEFVAPKDMYSDLEPLVLPSKRTPRSHQTLGNRLLVERDRWLLGWEAGAGKSKPVVDAATHLINEFEVDHVLVVTDASVVDTWVTKHIPKDTDYKGVGLIGTKAERMRALKAALTDPKVRFFVINYDGIRVMFDELLKLMTPKSVLVLDESQRIKDIKTTRFKKCYELVTKKQVRRVWALSGTPLTQRPEDIFGQYAVIDPSIYGAPKYWYAFNATYVIKNPNNKHHTIGYRNMDRFMRKLHSRCHRVKKEDVLDLPPLTYEQIEFELSPKLRKLYDEFIDTNGLLVDPVSGRTIYIAENRLAIMTKAHTLTKGWVYDGFDPANPDADQNVDASQVHYFFPDERDPRIDWLITFLLDTGAPTLVFFTHRADKPTILNRFEENGITASVIDGSVDIKLRGGIIEDFAKGRTDVFLGHAAAAGTGVDGLQERGKFIIYLGNLHSVEKRVQSEARLYRDGVRNAVGIYDLLYRNTCDISMYKSLMMKREFTSQIVDGGEEEFKNFMRGEVWL